MIKHVKVFSDEYRLTLNPSGKFVVTASSCEFPNVVKLGDAEIQVSDDVKFSQNGEPAELSAGKFVASEEIVISNDDYVSDLLSGVLINPEKLSSVPTMEVMKQYVDGQIGEFGVIQSPNGETVLKMLDSDLFSDERVLIDFVNGSSATIGPKVSQIGEVIFQAAGIQSVAPMLSHSAGITISPAVRLDYTSENIHEVSIEPSSLAVYAMPNQIDTGLYAANETGRYELTSSQRALAYSLLF